ncbi:hypothetical protein F2Q69_00024843 [Brassica cretica]|uniref:Uncharacterized protein n=1 Tax=Brassica cretica TaxID=69181 RepID=A0A8S9Q240_BRACR|nr:hypothetical protein F2Q69_00024843 [Brassica cretica]
MFSEVEEFYHHGHNDDEHVSSEVGDNQNKRNNSLKGKENVEEMGHNLLEEGKRDHQGQGQGQVEESSMGNKINPVDNVRNEDGAKSSSSSSSLMMIMRDKKKRKGKKKERFGVLKGFCEGLVRNMIVQQEEMHKKLLEDMTKDVNKKRPLDSRTCPYFHQLTALYSQPTTTATDTSTGQLETRVGSGDPDDIPAVMHVDANGAGEKSNVQFSGFDLALP